MLISRFKDTYKNKTMHEWMIAKWIKQITFGKIFLSFDSIVFLARTQGLKVDVLKFLGVTPFKQNSGKLISDPNWKETKRTQLQTSWIKLQRSIHLTTM